jgi:hypothetical protein
MKLMMTREEVQALVVNTINERLGTKFNKCEIDTYRYASDFAVLSVEEPPKAEGAENE